MLHRIHLFCLLLTFSLLSVQSPGKLNPASPTFILHSVKNNETVFSIAQKYGVTSEDIYLYNPNSKKQIRPGDILKIPQNALDKPQEKKDNPRFILYKVGRDESLYFIARKFNCTQEEILKLNPEISTINKGMLLKVPNPDFVPENTQKSSEPMTAYKIQSGDTYYNLKKRFGADQEQLEKVNPELKNGLRTGLTIKIPHQKVPEKTSEEALPLAEKIPDMAHVFNIGLYLPFKCDLNDSVTINPQTGNYLDFYEGSILAANDLASEGMKLKMFVYDTNEDPKVVEQLVKKPEFLSLDLIVGPVYPRCQEIISQLSGKNKIPMVSPLSPDSRFVSSDPYYFQINPDKRLRLNGTAEYVIKNFRGKNILFLSGEPQEEDSRIVLDKLRQKMNSSEIHLYDLWSDEREGIENHLVPDAENIVVLMESNVARVSVAITRLNTFSRNFRIKLIGLQEYTRMKSINTEYLHNLNLEYLSPYYIDYSNLKVKNFIAKFRENFSAEPSPYAFQGYDVMWGFLTALQKTGKGLTRVPMPKLDLLQADYNFCRVSTFGGFENCNFFVIDYSNSYEIKSVGRIKASF